MTLGTTIDPSIHEAKLIFCMIPFRWAHGRGKSANSCYFVHGFGLRGMAWPSSWLARWFWFLMRIEAYIYIFKQSRKFTCRCKLQTSFWETRNLARLLVVPPSIFVCFLGDGVVSHIPFFLCFSCSLRSSHAWILRIIWNPSLVGKRCMVLVRVRPTHLLTLKG